MASGNTLFIIVTSSVVGHRYSERIIKQDLIGGKRKTPFPNQEKLSMKSIPPTLYCNSKTGVYRGIPIFCIIDPKFILWVLVRTIFILWVLVFNMYAQSMKF